MGRRWQKFLEFWQADRISQLKEHLNAVREHRNKVDRLYKNSIVGSDYWRTKFYEQAKMVFWARSQWQYSREGYQQVLGEAENRIIQGMSHEAAVQKVGELEHEYLVLRNNIERVEAERDEALGDVIYYQWLMDNE